MTDATQNKSMRADPSADEGRSKRGLRGLLRRFRRRSSEANLREAIEELIEGTQTEDSNQPQTGESSLLRNILKLGDLTARDVMVPRVDILAAPESTDLKGLIELVRARGHSRVPIYREGLDDVVGVIHIKDVLPFIFDAENFDLKSIVREPIFVSPSIRVLDLLMQMRLSRAHLALVVDEFGGIDGLVTIEDLVEEIIGEIEDEHDVVRGPSLVQRPDGTWIADARTTIDEFEARVGNVLGEAEREQDISTLGGLVMSLTERVPSRGELVTHSSGVMFEVVDADPRRIKRLRVRMPAAAPHSERPGG
jgi:CBS domain containing-hemolysin-like protein